MNWFLLSKLGEDGKSSQSPEISLTFQFAKYDSMFLNIRNKLNLCSPAQKRHLLLSDGSKISHYRNYIQYKFTHITYFDFMNKKVEHKSINKWTEKRKVSKWMALVPCCKDILDPFSWQTFSSGGLFDGLAISVFSWCTFTFFRTESWIILVVFGIQLKRHHLLFLGLWV